MNWHKNQQNEHTPVFVDVSYFKNQWGMTTYPFKNMKKIFLKIPVFLDALDNFETL